jgi:hypothetical protein
MIIERHNAFIRYQLIVAEISWDNAKIHMQLPEMLRSNWVDTLEQELLYAHDPDTMDAERIQGIIESKYTPADLSKIVEECTHLKKAEQKQLLKLLQKYEDLFDGLLGTWKTVPIQLELKDPNAKPYHAKPYPVPHSQEQRLKDEIRHTVCQKLLDCNTLGRLSAQNAKNNHMILLVRISIRAATRSIIEMKNDVPVMLSGNILWFFSTIRTNTFRATQQSGQVHTIRATDPPLPQSEHILKWH